MANYINITKMTTESCASFDYPVLEIHNINGTVGYLMPFRFYRFQVCGNKAGICDMGASEIKKLEDIVMWHRNAKFLLKLEAISAINDHLNTSYGDVKKNVAYTINGQIPLTSYMQESVLPYGFDELVDCSELAYLDEFIDATYNLIVDYYKIMPICNVG